MIGDLIRAFVEGLIARELARGWHLEPGFRIESLTFHRGGEVSVSWSYL